MLVIASHGKSQSTIDPDRFGPLLYYLSALVSLTRERVYIYQFSTMNRSRGSVGNRSFCQLTGISIQPFDAIPTRFHS